MSRRPRVQAPPPPPCPWPAFAAASAPCTEPLVADSTESNCCTASMESMSITPPAGWWNPFVPAQGTGSFPAMPQKESSVYPPGGFLSYFNNSPNPHLFHNVAPPPSLTRGSPPSSDVNSCDENEDCRSGKRLTWTAKEDERLFSAWLNNSNDPINGNCKKTERYWQDVTTMYNSTTPKERRREMNQLKDRFHRVNKRVGWFAASWLKACRIWPSGQNDLQLREKALKFYEDDYKDGQFKHMNCWKAVEGSPKWESYMERLEKLKKRKFSELGEATVDLTVDEDNDIPRPPGTKAAKAERKTKCKGKGKTAIALEEINDMEEKLDKFMAAQAEASKGRNDMVEVARLNAAAAKEKKEAKMMDTYKWMFMQDTTNMPEDMKAEHMKAVKSLREKLFGSSD